MKVELPGINIQFPISQLIVAGSKTIETRTYDIPKDYLNTEILMIETPGRKGKFQARAVAIIKFTESFKYKNKDEFYEDSSRHMVDQKSPWAWKNEKPKWGWGVEVVKKFKHPIKLECKRGIVFTKSIAIEIE